jgi:hypothetical protein
MGLEAHQDDHADSSLRCPLRLLSRPTRILHISARTSPLSPTHHHLTRVARKRIEDRVDGEELPHHLVRYSVGERLQSARVTGGFSRASLAPRPMALSVSEGRCTRSAKTHLFLGCNIVGRKLQHVAHPQLSPRLRSSVMRQGRWRPLRGHEGRHPAPERQKRSHIA